MEALNPQLNVLVLGDRRICQPWVATSVHEVLKGTVQENVFYHQQYSGKQLLSTQAYTKFKDISDDTLAETDVVLLVGNEYVNKNIRKIIPLLMIKRPYVVLIAKNLDPRSVQDVMTELGCADRYELIPSLGEDLLMKVVCKQQDIPYRETSTSVVDVGEAKRSQDIREKLRAKKEQQAQQKQKLDTLALKVEKCAKAFKFGKSDEEKALAKETFEELAFIKTQQVAPYKTPSSTISRLVLAWQEFSPKDFSAEEIAFVKPIWENSGEYRRQQEATEKERKRIEKQFSSSERSAERQRAQAASDLFHSEKRLAEDQRVLERAQADLAKAQGEAERANAESREAMAQLFSTATAPTPSPTSYAATAARLAEAEQRSAAVKKEKEEAGKRATDQRHRADEAKAAADAQRERREATEKEEVVFVTSRGGESGSRDDEAQPLLRINPRDLFFRYDYINPQDAKFSHSRCVSAKIINDTLTPGRGGYTDKQLIMLFAEYMKIRHVNSQFSRVLEEKLIDGLGYVDRLHDINSRRATIRGKAHDRIAAGLREKMREKFGNRHAAFNNIDLLIDLLKVVDRLETSFWYRSNEPKIRDVIALADKVYNQLMENGRLYTWNADTVMGNLKNQLPYAAKSVLRSAISAAQKAADKDIENWAGDASKFDRR